MLKGIIFDMDGVLCDSEPFICEAACRMFSERFGVQAQKKDFDAFVGMGEERYLCGVAGIYGVDVVMPDDKVLTYEIYLELIKGRLQPLRGVAEFMMDARNAGLKMAVATSADEMKMLGNLKEIGQPPEAFDALVNGLDVERKKPFPDIFVKAAGLLGLEPEDCMVIEDAPAGIEAAGAAGCSSLGLTTSFSVEQLKSAGAGETAADLEDARALLSAMMAE